MRRRGGCPGRALDFFESGPAASGYPATTEFRPHLALRQPSRIGSNKCIAALVKIPRIGHRPPGCCGVRTANVGTTTSGLQSQLSFLYPLHCVNRLRT